MTDKKVHERAAEVEQHLQKHVSATTSEIAEALDLPEEEVSSIIDTHSVDEDGKIKNLGPGAGGGWHPARQAAARRASELEGAAPAEDE